MCLGIPMRVIEAGEHVALCERGPERRRIDLALVGPQPVGAWLLTFLDAAREVLSEAQAQQIERALQGLEAALAGRAGEVDAFFADLVGREPQLPAHLRKEDA